MPMLGLSVSGTQAGQGIAEIMKTQKVLAGMLLRDGIISPDEVEIVEYGLENLGSSLLGMLMYFHRQCCWYLSSVLYRKGVQRQYILVAIIPTGVIFLMAPVENNKYLDQTKQKVYRKRTRIILSLERMLFMLALVLDLEELIVAITIVLFIVCTSLLTGRIKL